MLEQEQNEKKVVGLKQTHRAISEGNAKAVYIAKDADKKVAEPIIKLCKKFAIEITYAESMEKLGKDAGIEIGAAFVTILKD